MQYTVKAGDTLSKIARDVVGDLNRWPEIAARNQLASPYTIRVGQVLDLPDPGTLKLGPVLPATPPPMVPAGTATGGGAPIGGAWWASPWLWLAGGAAVWWALRGRKPASRRRKSRPHRARRPC